MIEGIVDQLGKWKSYSAKQEKKCKKSSRTVSMVFEIALVVTSLIFVKP